MKLTKIAVVSIFIGAVVSQAGNSLAAGAAIMQGETTPGVYTNVSVNSSGQMAVTGTFTASGAAQGSTTAGQTGGLVQGATTTTAPTYTTATTNPLSLTTGGALRVDASGSALAAGTNSIGKVVVSVPNATTVTALSQATNATGTTYNTFTSTACTALDIVNNTGVVVEYQRGGSGTAIPIQAASSRLVIGITNASAIGVRRTDVSNTPVTVVAECIVN